MLHVYIYLCTMEESRIWVPDMEVVGDGDVLHGEEMGDGVEEGAVGAEVEAVDPREGEAGAGWGDGGGGLVGGAAPGGRELVLLPVGAAGRLRRQGGEAEGGHDRLQLVVGKDGLERLGVPQRQLPHELLHTYIYVYVCMYVCIYRSMACKRSSQGCSFFVFKFVGL